MAIDINPILSLLADNRKITLLNGKQPVTKDWPTKDVSLEEIKKHIKNSGNVGYRLDGLLVIDVDPKNGGDVEAVVAAFDIDQSVSVETGRGNGGCHICLTLPEGVEADGLRTKLPEFEGVEFKSGNKHQVVAPGSLHPEPVKGTDGVYKWDELWCSGWPVGGPSEAPEELISALLKRKRTPKATEEPRENDISPELLSEMLAALDVADFRDQGTWLEHMMACHEATGGVGREEFIAWSTGDPDYQDHEDKIAERWNSLEADEIGGVTRRTLFKKVIEAGRSDLVPRNSAVEDFRDDEIDEDTLKFISKPEAVSIVDAMNAKFCCVLNGGKFVIMKDEIDHGMGDRRVMHSMTRDAFRHFYEDETISVPQGDRIVPMSKADVWLKSPNRRKYEGIVLDPQNLTVNKNKLNLWRGWNCNPMRKQRGWSLVEELIHDVLCDGDQSSAEYVKRWIAFMLQKPWETPGVAIAFRGREGTGKGTLGRILMRLAGTHGLTVSSPSQFAGRFNAHLKDCVFLFADEAMWPGHKDAEGTLKQLVTEPVISYEGKGDAIISGRNLIHIMMASNEEWVVPASTDARRFFVSDVSDVRRFVHVFFGRRLDQMESGVLEAWMFDFMYMELGDWKPSKEIPQTKALADQKVHSLGPIDQFWHSRLVVGEMPEAGDGMVDWSEEAIHLVGPDKDLLVQMCHAHLKERGMARKTVSKKALVTSGKKLGLYCGKTNSGANRAWSLPKLADARAKWASELGDSTLFDD